MRIIAGKYKNRMLNVPPDDSIRPILSRVRKSVFDILQPHLVGADMLDLFMGTGGMALEAFSRGAAKVTSVDLSQVAINLGKTNHQHVCPDEDYRILKGNVLEMLPYLASQGESFDVIGITPPYGEGLQNATVKLLDKHISLLKPDTVIYVQREFVEDLSLEWKHLEHVRQKKYGRTLFDFFLPNEGLIEPSE